MYSKYNRPKVDRLGEGKRTKYINRNINKNSILERSVKFDCSVASVTSVATTNDPNAATGYERFAGYKFTRHAGDSGDLVWNDGIFWSWMNNFRELPIAAAKDITGSDTKNAESTSSIMWNNRKLHGGCVTYQRSNVAADPASTCWVANSDTEIGDSKSSLPLPFLVVENTSGVHQVSQTIDITETMVQTKAVDDGTGNKHVVMYPAANFADVTTATDQSLAFADTATEKLVQNSQFAVRNICILVPNNYHHDSTGSGSSYNDMTGTGMQAFLEEAVLSELLMRAKGTYGKPSGKNNDLYRPINPRFKVLRDWVSFYGFKPDHSHSQTRSRFYHRYNHNVKTECATDNTTSVDIQGNSGSMDSKQCQVAAGLDQNRGTGNISGCRNMIFSTNEYGDNMGTKGLPYQFRNQEEVIEAGASTGITADIRTEMGVDETALPMLIFRDEQEFKDKVPVMQPVSHRVVWLRLPRFAGKIELEDINSNNLLVTPFLSTAQTKTWIDSLGTMVKGNACWKVLRPECSPSGGSVTAVRVRADTGVYVTGSAADEL